MVRSGEAVMEKVRRYRATASLYRQTASFRPLQRWSLLDQAEEWERLAVENWKASSSSATAGTTIGDRQSRDTPRRRGKLPLSAKRTLCLCEPRRALKAPWHWRHELLRSEKKSPGRPVSAVPSSVAEWAVDIMRATEGIDVKCARHACAAH